MTGPTPDAIAEARADRARRLAAVEHVERAYEDMLVELEAADRDIFVERLGREIRGLRAAVGG